MTLGVGADFDECPDAMAVDRGGVEAAVEANADDLMSRGTSVGEVGVVDLATAPNGTSQRGPAPEEPLAIHVPSCRAQG